MTSLAVTSRPDQLAFTVMTPMLETNLRNSIIIHFAFCFRCFDTVSWCRASIQPVKTLFLNSFQRFTFGFLACPSGLAIARCMLYLNQLSVWMGSSSVCARIFSLSRSLVHVLFEINFSVRHERSV